MNSLRQAATAVRSAAALFNYNRSEAVTELSTIKAEHLTELRTAIDGARQAIGMTLSSYTDSLLPVVTTIRAIHIDELRKAVK